MTTCPTTLSACIEPVSATNEAWKTLQSDNKIVPPTPYSIPLMEKLEVAQSSEVTLVVHAGRKGKQDLSLLFVYREVSGGTLMLPLC